MLDRTSRSMKKTPLIWTNIRKNETRHTLINNEKDQRIQEVNVITNLLEGPMYVLRNMTVQPSNPETNPNRRTNDCKKVSIEQNIQIHLIFNRRIWFSISFFFKSKANETHHIFIKFELIQKFPCIPEGNSNSSFD